MNTNRIVFAGLIALMGLVSASSAFAYKSIVYNGIECAYRNDNTSSANTWVPSTPGLYGFGGSVVYCPIVQQAEEGYNFSKLSYVMLYGINIQNPKLCRRGSNNATACGASSAIGSSAWILYKPAGGNQYDDAFLSVSVGSGTSLIREYAAVWND